ncbi:flagellin hook IN motif-containing protein, partial [Desulfobacter sp.]|uniref:flagellin N-terminal helical domain-containing protein n=1 Tax=Desulfobacter sp. TaxID=2294 RepID=UPI003D0C04D4
MSLSINTNVAALTAHRNMVATNNDMTTSLTRLSTGLRINSSADDASGLTIADSLAAQADGLGQGIQNANDGVSIVQTADGALEESVNIVNTIKTKAIQAASDTQTTTTRSAIQDDINKLLEELDSIATTTSYNGMQLLNGTYTNKVIHTGASANETSSISIGNTESDSIGHISTATLALDDQEGSTVQLSITSNITGQEIDLKAITIEANNKEENGLGALADEINSVSSATGISAVAVVETTSENAIQAGTTGSDFSINGVNIGAINVEDGDSGSALVTAINDKTSETGISAVNNTEGTITLTSDDGRVISVTGDLGGVFG